MPIFLIHFQKFLTFKYIIEAASIYATRSNGINELD